LIRNLKVGQRQLSGFSINMFSDDELRDIHSATLEVLNDTGILVMDQEARDIMAGVGCVVEKDIVRIPPYIVEETIRSCPSKVLLAGRNPKYDMILEGRRVGFTNFAVGVMIVDPYTGELKETTNDSVAQTALICDAMDQVDIFSSAVVGRDKPEYSQDLHDSAAMFKNTSKHISHGDLISGENTKRFFRMAAEIVGGEDELRKRPIVSTITCPVSPLQLSDLSCRLIIESARWGIPCNVLSMAMSGATSPITLAGTLVTHNAEVLGGLVLSQATCKGAPIIYGSSTTTFDLTYVTAPVGAPELGMTSAGVAALAEMYNLPSYVAGG